jgi:hypothetical protein
LRQRAAVATEVPPNFMTIQGALSGNGAFAFSLTGFLILCVDKSPEVLRCNGKKATWRRTWGHLQEPARLPVGAG